MIARPTKACIMDCETTSSASPGPVKATGETLSELAAAIDTVIAELEDDWRRRHIVRPGLADRLHQLVEDARRLTGAGG
jgi:hypothetical protein